MIRRFARLIVALMLVVYGLQSSAAIAGEQLCAIDDLDSQAIIAGSLGAGDAGLDLDHDCCHHPHFFGIAVAVLLLDGVPPAAYRAVERLLRAPSILRFFCVRR